MRGIIGAPWASGTWNPLQSCDEMAGRGGDMKAVLLTLSAVASLGVTHAHGQSPLASPMFEVATVRQNTGLSDASRISGPTPGRFTITNVPLVFILHHAYQALAHQLVGAPDWVG